MTSVKEPHFQHQHNFTPTEKKMQQKNKKMAGEKGDRRETRETSPIWSNDSHLKKQQKVECYTTEEILDLLPTRTDNLE
jgi:hypothetical protein